jgi:hypothetical protein
MKSLALIESEEITDSRFAGRNFISFKNLNEPIDVVSLISSDRASLVTLSAITQSGKITSERKISLPASPGAMVNMSDPQHLWFIPSGSIHFALGERVFGVALDSDQKASTITLPKGQVVVGLLGSSDGVTMAIDDGIPTNARGSTLQMFDSLGNREGQSETVTTCEFASPFASINDPSTVGARCTHMRRGAFDNYSLNVDNFYVFQRTQDGSLKTVESLPINLKGQLLGASFGRDDSGQNVYVFCEDGGQLSIYVR